jgi:histidyl-tRNA synthetase
LHFDLTIPFARYTLDHLQELVFPFKRYQMQPVRRGERQKRGRYKEFRQWDIDTIWRDSQSV